MCITSLFDNSLQSCHCLSSQFQFYSVEFRYVALHTFIIGTYLRENKDITLMRIMLWYPNNDSDDIVGK